ncbi:MAG: HEAT repeat domain-containing protein [Acidobacteriota bacterium]|nr:HEAT repeat domain-containing protein [Acidobacteriota bacterium]
MNTPKSTSPPEPSWDECMDLLGDLPGMSLADRTSVIETLLRNSSPGIRERALRMGVATMPDQTLVSFLRNDSDAVLRNAALEILKKRGSSSFSLAIELLRDNDADVALQGILILDHIKDPRAVEPLRSSLHHEDANLAQAAIVAIGHLGDARSIPDLLPFLDSDTWLQIAAVQALGDLRSPQAIEPLNKLLTDLLVGPMAGEAIAQIGGSRALKRLSEHWLKHQRELDPETNLGLLAHVLEGLPEAPNPAEALRASLAERLRDPYRQVRESAARCLLALGPGPEDAEALNLLSGISPDPEVLPSCLARRRDLIDTLLERPGVFRSWGFLLSSHYPDVPTAGPLQRAMSSAEPPTSLRPILDALSQLRGKALGRPLLHLYLGLPAASRPELLPLLKLHREGLESALSERDDLAVMDRLILDAALGEDPGSVGKRIAGLSHADRVDVIFQLSDQAELMRVLPWPQWLAEAPDEYVAIASEAAVGSDLRELLPVLRALLPKTPCAELIRALGELRDRESVSALLALLKNQSERHFRPLIVESLGRIGGPEARLALRDIARSGHDKDVRIGYKSLAQCASEEDDSFFLEAASHPDWLVRLSSVEVLSRNARSENLAALSELAADPIGIVAQRALAALKTDVQ